MLLPCYVNGNSSFSSEDLKSVDSEILLLENILEEMDESLLEIEEKYSLSEREWITAKHMEDEGDKLSVRKSNFAELKFKKNKSLYERKLSRIGSLKEKIDALNSKRDNLIRSQKGNTSIKEVTDSNSKQASSQFQNNQKIDLAKLTNLNGEFAESSQIEKPIQKITSNAKTKKTKTDNDKSLIMKSISSDSSFDAESQPEENATITQNNIGWPRNGNIDESSISFAKSELKRLESIKEEPLLGKVTLKSRGISNRELDYLAEGIYTATLKLEKGVNEIKILNKVFIVDSSLHELKGDKPIYRVVFDVASLSSPKLYIFEEMLIK